MNCGKIVTRFVPLALFGFLSAICSLSCVPAEVISVMSANITSGTHSAYEGPGIRIFQGLQPDIVLIQEFNYEYGTLRDLVDEAFGPEFDYYVEPGGDSIPNGVVSRFPIVSSGEWTDYEVSNRDFAWAVIDIPGAIDLQVVSIHLKSGSSDSGTRNDQARAIKDYVEAQFDANQYIAVGGDLNTYTVTESALNTFRSFLDADDHIPVDQEGNMNTSEPRTKPYDWVMPNTLLDAIHTVLEIPPFKFPDGLVFDSYVYDPLPLPVLYDDSHVNGMQHMAVMKAFQIPPAM